MLNNVYRWGGKRFQHINHIHKWRLSNYSFVFMLIILTSLVSTDKIQKNYCAKVRLLRMIITKTKEKFLGRHLWITTLHLRPDIQPPLVTMDTDMDAASRDRLLRTRTPNNRLIYQQNGNVSGDVARRKNTNENSE